MPYDFVTVDVFTGTRFGGNPLAVLPNASGLDTAQMQQIAREFNYSESTFVFPPEQGKGQEQGDGRGQKQGQGHGQGQRHIRRVRIFTPTQEVPFAGHPNVGTAFVLASAGAFGALGPSLEVTFDEAAGPVPITIHAADGRVTECELRAPQPVSFGPTVPAALVASAVTLAEEDIVTATHHPLVVSVGLPFVMAELRDRAALERVRARIAGFEALRDQLAGAFRASLYLYVRTSEGADVHARMLAPLSGVHEDPATGSAGCAVAGLLAHHDGDASGEYAYRIAQGVEMGRPSLLKARARKAAGAVTATWIGGACVHVCEGRIHVGEGLGSA